MKQIDAFVDEIYQNAKGNRKEIQELKTEMKGHLTEAALELKEEGKTEQEAVEMAIERFGGKQEMLSVVGQLFEMQKVFAKRVLYIALSFLVLTSIACAVLWVMDEANMEENMAVASEIVSILEGQEAVSEDMEEAIFSLVNDKYQILNLQVFRAADAATISETTEPAYEYGVANPNRPDWIWIELGYSLGGTDWYVEMESTKIFGFVPFISSIGIAIYATLFTIWATINAYHHRRLNVGWVIVFALLNILGYLIYMLTKNRTTSLDAAVY